MGWLETLVWPEQQGRRERLRAAINLARQDPPQVQCGDLLKDLDAILSHVPIGLTPVDFHTAVLAYGNERDRQSFARDILDSGVIWISNEAAGVFPQIAVKVKGPQRHDRFLLAVDGEPVAWTGPHGQSIEWMDNK
jgi:hypothetical protein